MPCLSALHYNFQCTSIALAYHLFIILTLKILPNSIFSIFFCPYWRPIIILHLVSKLGFITLGARVCNFGRAREFCLQIWRSALIQRTFISQAGTCAKYMKEANSFKTDMY